MTCLGRLGSHSKVMLERDYNLFSSKGERMFILKGTVMYKFLFAVMLLGIWNSAYSEYRVEYGYDDFGRLVSITRSDLVMDTEDNVRYQYDELGNRSTLGAYSDEEACSVDVYAEDDDVIRGSVAWVIVERKGWCPMDRLITVWYEVENSSSAWTGSFRLEANEDRYREGFSFPYYYRKAEIVLSVSPPSDNSSYSEHTVTFNIID